MEKIIYTGYFLENPMMGNLEVEIANQHITHEFKPKELNQDLIGSRIKFKAYAYANDGENEAYLVRPYADDYTMRLLSNIKVPHVTLSVSATGKPVNSGKLKFEPIEYPFYFWARYGYFNGKEVVTRQ